MATKKKTGSIKVQFARLQEDVKEITLPKGSSVAVLLNAVGIAGSDFQSALGGLRMNGDEVTLDTKLVDGAFYTLTPSVKGGAR